MSVGTNNQKQKALFSLSNITGSLDKSLIHSFIEDEQLVALVFQQSHNLTHMLKCEAVWVITNTVTQADSDGRAQMKRKYGIELIRVLCARLRDMTEKKLDDQMIELLSSIDLLLQLVYEFPDEFGSEAHCSVQGILS